MVLYTFSVCASTQIVTRPRFLVSYYTSLQVGRPTGNNFYYALGLYKAQIVYL